MKKSDNLRLPKTVSAAFAVLLLCACGPTYQAAIQEGQTAAQDMIQQGSATSITMALVDSNQLIWSQSFGLADREAGMPPTENTTFGIGSISKVFASIAVMKLAERGALKLDEPIVTYLPSFKMADENYKKITTRMLINHSAGLGTDYRNAITRAPAPQYLNQLLDGLSTKRLSAPPGYMSVYCNDCFTLVEAVVGATSGKTYANFVQDEIFTPLGMEHTRFANTAFPAGSYAKSYDKGSPKPQEVVNLLASGGITSTANDMARIAIMFLNRGIYGQTRILSEDSVAQMALDQTLSQFNPVHSNTWAYGLGWDTVSQPGLLAVGFDGWAKGGDTGDYNSFMIVSPKAKLGVVVLGASGFSSEKAKAISERVLLRALAENGAIPIFPVPLQRVVPAATTPDGVSLASMAGEYATSALLLKLEAQPDGSLLFLTRSKDAWNASGDAYKLRNDGWFTTDTNPLSSLKVMNADLLGVPTQYMVNRAPGGYGHYLDLSVVAERVNAKTNDLSTVWTARLSKTWLAANRSPDDLTWSGIDPRLRLTTIPELKGLIAAYAPRQPTELMILDPSTSNEVALSMLIVPQLNGRDLSDFIIVKRGLEEWVSFGSYLHRPLETVPSLQRNTTNLVTIGSEGNSEWRSVMSAVTPARITITTTGDWLLYDSSFTRLANGKGNGVASLPAANGPGYIVLFGKPGERVTVRVD